MHAIPTQANEALSSGLVRIDATWATVKTLVDDSQVLSLDKDAAGQWMGEVGVDRQIIVREISDDRLVEGWSQLGHSNSNEVAATITWNNGKNFDRVAVSAPELTPRGHLRFTIAKENNLPPRMEGVDINIIRSEPRKVRSFPVTESFTLTESSSTTTTLNFAYAAKVSISDSGLRCYELTLLQSAPQQQLPSNLQCGLLNFTTGQFTMTLPSPTQSGSVLFVSSMMVSGTPFNFNSVIASWTVNG